MNEENLFKENIEKSKEVLKDHFERRKMERETEKMVRGILPHYSTLEIHHGDNWETDDSEFDDFAKKEYEKLVWDTPIKKSKKER